MVRGFRRRKKICTAVESALSGAVESRFARWAPPAFETLENRRLLSGYAVSNLASFYYGLNGLPGSMIMDSKGNLYGSSGHGGEFGDGYIFKIKKGSKTVSTLAPFSSDISALASPIRIDNFGDIFFLADFDNTEGIGEVAKGSHVISAVPFFIGKNPQTLGVDGQGNLFVAADDGGFEGSGIIYELPEGGGTPAQIAAFGEGPLFSNFFYSAECPLIFDAAGDLFGVQDNLVYSNIPGGRTQTTTQLYEIARGINSPAILASFPGDNSRELLLEQLIVDSHGNIYAEDNQDSIYRYGKNSGTIVTISTQIGGEDEGLIVADETGNLFGVAGDYDVGGAYIFEIPKGSRTPQTLTAFNDQSPFYNSEAALFAVDSHDNLFGLSGDVFDQNVQDSQNLDYSGYAFEISPTIAAGNADPNSTSVSGVNVSNGNVNRSATDISLPAIGSPLAFTRVYNSESTLDLGMGQGWSFTASDTLTLLQDQSLLWTDDQGHEFDFTSDGGGGYITPNTLHGALAAITTAAGAGFAFRDSHGLTHTFGPSPTSGTYDLLSVLDRNGNGQNITYRKSGQLKTFSDADNPSRTLSIAYDSTGHIDGVTDFSGRLWTYAYTTQSYSDGFTRTLLASVTSPSDSETAAQITRYGYSSAQTGEAHASDTTGGLLASILDADNDATSFNYNADGTVAAEIDALGHITTFTYDVADFQTTIEDPRLISTVYQYDGLGELVAEVHADGSQDSYVWSRSLLQSHTDPLAFVETYGYDALGNLTTFTDANGFTTHQTYDPTFSNLLTSTDPNGHTTVYTYDSFGNNNSIQDAAGNVTSMTYDSHGLMLTQTTRRHNTTTFTYDTAGQLLTIHSPLPSLTTYSYDTREDLTRADNADNEVTTTTYDLLGRVLTITDAMKHVTAFTYDALGLPLSETNADGNLTTFSYDHDHRLTLSAFPDGSHTSRTLDPDGLVNTQTDALGHTTTYVYDNRNRPYEVIDALNNITTTVYDTDSRVLSVTDSRGDITKYTYDHDGRLLTTTDAMSNILTIAYDAAGNIIRQTDALGHVSSFTYDARNLPATQTDPLGHVTTHSYDADGNLASVTDPLGNMTLYTYDVIDRLTKTKNAAGKTTKTAYDAVGNISTVTDALGHVTTYAYDADNRRIRSIDPLGNVTTTTYDNVGNVATVTDPLRDVTRYGYDAVNRPTTVTSALNFTTTTTYDLAGNVKSVTDPDGNTTSYTYDADNHELTQTNAQGSRTTFTYDPAGNLKSETDADGRLRRFAYDLDNRRTRESWVNGNDTITYTYDADGNLATVSDANSSYAYAYNAVGLVKSVDNTASPNMPVVVLRYRYDADGNLISDTDSAGGTLAATYDALNQATTLTESAAGFAPMLVTFSYDAVGDQTGIARYGNLTAAGTPIFTTLAYDPAGNLKSINSTFGKTTLSASSYTYDAASRLSVSSTPDGVTTYTYDSTDQLTSAVNSTQPAATYTYDANGNRTGTGFTTAANNEIKSDGIYTYTYDPVGNMTSRTDLAGNVTTYVWDYRNRLTEVKTASAKGGITSDVRFTYDALDRRTAESVDSDGAGPVAPAVTRFVYDGNNVALQFNGNNKLKHRYLHGPGVDEQLADDSTAGGILWLLADNQGTIRDLVNTAGVVVNHIQYDSYGNVISQTNFNVTTLYGYTGQQQDAATGLDYYRARYYDPAIGRFISQDPSGFAAGDANLYRYAGDGPPNHDDPTGLDDYSGGNYYSSTNSDVSGDGNGGAADNTDNGPGSSGSGGNISNPTSQTDINASQGVRQPTPIPASTSNQNSGIAIDENNTPIDTSLPESFAQQTPNPERRDAFVTDALDASEGDLGQALSFLQDERNANNGALRYDLDLTAASHELTGAAGAQTFGTTAQIIITDFYELIKMTPGGNFILADPFNSPAPSPPNAYVLQSAELGAGAVYQPGVPLLPILPNMPTDFRIPSA